MLERTNFNTVVKELNINAQNRPKSRTRKLALKWGCYKARQEFKDYGKDMASLGKAVKDDIKNPIKTLGNLFDVIFMGPFGSAETILSATAKVIHGLAGAVIHPALIIKKSETSYHSSNSSSNSSQSESNYSTQIEDSSAVKVKKKKKKKKVKVQNKKKSEEVAESEKIESLEKPKKKKKKKIATSEDAAPVKKRKRKKKKKTESVKNSSVAKSASEEPKIKAKDIGEIIRDLKRDGILEDNEEMALFNLLEPSEVKISDQESSDEERWFLLNPKKDTIQMEENVDMEEVIKKIENANIDEEDKKHLLEEINKKLTD